MAIYSIGQSTAFSDFKTALQTATETTIVFENTTNLIFTHSGLNGAFRVYIASTPEAPDFYAGTGWTTGASCDNERSITYCGSYDILDAKVAINANGVFYGMNADASNKNAFFMAYKLTNEDTVATGGFGDSMYADDAIGTYNITSGNNLTMKSLNFIMKKASDSTFFSSDFYFNDASLVEETVVNTDGTPAKQVGVKALNRPVSTTIGYEVYDTSLIIQALYTAVNGGGTGNYITLKHSFLIENA